MHPRPLSLELQRTEGWGFHFSTPSGLGVTSRQTLNFSFSCDFHTKTDFFSYFQLWRLVTPEPLGVGKRNIPRWKAPTFSSLELQGQWAWLRYKAATPTLLKLELFHSSGCGSLVMKPRPLSLELQRTEGWGFLTRYITFLNSQWFGSNELSN